MHGIDGRWHNEPPHVIPAPPIPRPPLPPEFTAADSEVLRFSLKELFFAITIAAVMLAMFRSIGIFGALVSFLSAILITFLVTPRLFSDNLARQRIIFDFVWGIVMPIVCLVFDPFVFKFGEFDDPEMMFIKPGKIHIYPTAYFVWPFLGGQITTLALILVGGKSVRGIAPVLAGTLGTGFLFALFLALLLFVPAVFGTMFFGIGFLGFTPILTAYSYSRRLRLMRQLSADDRPGRRVALTTLGIVLCLLFPILIGSLIRAITPPDNFSLDDFLP